ncbi:hypothetical protein E3J62_11390 [candidate division TA06 bacterium]|uniref:Uncharacterized protein n=1 Tax=candidate division TA06 bacterium TaxID=2250710 RepID=A0A523UNC5_UNCT6|nr:MAG: hypothetical protein E3J62_11390 [candidate division TA06 bacterium]
MGLQDVAHRGSASFVLSVLNKSCLNIQCEGAEIEGKIVEVENKAQQSIWYRWFREVLVCEALVEHRRGGPAFSTSEGNVREGSSPGP